MAAGQKIRYHTLNTETFRNQTHDIVDRLLLDSMADEVFVLQTVRDRLDPKTYEDVKRPWSRLPPAADTSGGTCASSRTPSTSDRSRQQLIWRTIYKRGW